MNLHFCRLLAALLALTFGTAHAQAPTAPYKVSVWSRVLFGPDGRATEISIVDAGRYPAAFVQNVKKRLAGARVPPVERDGKPAVLTSGVEMRFVVTPTAEGGTVRVDGVTIAPMPTRQVFASIPDEIRRVGGWQGEVVTKCTVSVDGKCSSIEVTTPPGMPESLRRFAKASLEQWEFEPQQIDGKPIEGEYTLRIHLNTLDAAPENFRQDKFLRILQSR